MVLAVIPARDVQAVGLDGVIVGSCDDRETDLVIAAKNEGVERSNAGDWLLVYGNARHTQVRGTHAPSP